MRQKNINPQKTILIGWSFWFFIIVIQGCSSSAGANLDNSKVIAQMGDEVLTENMLQTALGPQVDLTSERVKNYVRLWAEGKVMSAFARTTLSESEQDFTQALKKYESSLLRYTLEQKLVDSLLEKTISEVDVKAYFDNNPKDFELKENIVRVRYVKVPKAHKKLSTIKYLIQYKDSVQQAKFFDLVQSQGLFTVANDSSWTRLSELKNLVPIKLYNDEHYLRNYKYAEAPEGDDVWIVYFSEKKLKESVTPIELVEDKIKAIILNQRKRTLVQKKENELYKKALKEGALKIFL